MTEDFRNPLRRLYKAGSTAFTIFLSHLLQIDIISRLYLIGSFVIFFPLWTSTNQNFKSSGALEQTLRDPYVQQYAVAAFASCIPMIIDLLLDARIPSQDSYVTVRLLSLSSLAIFAGLFVMLSSYEGTGAYSYGDILNCFAYWQLFTVLFVFLHMLHTLDQRGVFHSYRIYILLMLFFTYTMMNIISDIFATENQNSFSSIAYACVSLFYILIIILSITWIYKIKRNAHTYESKAQLMANLTYKEYCCLYLVLIIIFIAPLWAALPYFLYSSNQGRLSDHYLPSSFICGNFVLRSIMVILRYLRV